VEEATCGDGGQVKYRSHAQKAAAKRQAATEHQLAIAKENRAQLDRMREVMAECEKAEAERDALAAELAELRKHKSAKKTDAPKAPETDAPKAQENEG
jgi:hypothetical protein